MSLLLAPAIANTVLGYSPGGLPGGNHGRVLIAPGHVNPRFTPTRAQASGARSTALAPDGTTWQGYGPNFPRFNGPSRRLLVGGQRTNLVPNPTCEGAVLGPVGSGGALPTGWTRTGEDAEVVGTGTINGLQYFDVRVTAASTTTTFSQFTFLPTGSSDITAETSMTMGVFCALIGGSLANVTSISHRQVWANGSPSSSSFGAFVPNSQLTRYTSTVTASTGATALASGGLVIIHSAGVALDFTLRIASPTVEIAPFASNPIWPAVGTPGASTRGTEIISGLLSNFGISGPCSFYGVVMLPQFTAINQFILSVDDGSNTNAYRFFNISGSTSLRYGSVNASVVNTLTVGDMTVGVPFRWGMAFDGAGNSMAQIGGGTLHTNTGGPTNITSVRIGNNFTNAFPMHGELWRLYAIPSYPSQAELTSRIARLPLN